MELAPLDVNPLSLTEARALVDAIRVHLDGCRALVLELYERQGWKPLGYASWRECVVAEFEQSQAYLYRQLRAAETETNISPTGEIGTIPERQLRPLTSLEPEQQREVWTEAVARSETGEPTAALVETVVRDLNYKRDSKINYGEIDPDAPRGFDVCQTPGFAIDPLLPYLSQTAIVWEPACGEGLLVEAFYDSGMKVIHSDILTGQNFFEYEPSEHWDVIITNPPYSLKHRWIERCYEFGKPFALLLPVETLGNKTAQEMFSEHGMEIILLDKRIPFKMPNKGWEGAGPQFSVAWFTWGFGVGRDIAYAKMERK